MRVYVGDPHRATDVRAIPDLTGQEDVRLIGMTLPADLGDLPSLGASAHQPQANPLFGNIEGMAVVGHAPDGRVRLLLVSDDNRSPTRITGRTRSPSGCRAAREAVVHGLRAMPP